ncbi:hypothetical protein SNE25_21050 [Mucilaginibacter sabulilitoris]|uniref:Uncharacterized protein n=1 Tax=Mucilaginibacter sabulilitoris TaxID=1173583 RepID=A0ABZ0TGE0_9SPHI|nr:hypothetical protein [Mucilaginibacter sabulilitoris]WPU91809.1 hypothetical protein SNE25_21050 [Mucilaginibacter sabulilitoris]
MVPSLNPKLQGRYPIIDLLFDLELAEERRRGELLSGTFILPDDTIQEIKQQLVVYCN